MSKILFIPFSVLSGILAGIIGKKTFERVWGIFDHQGTPDPKQREVALPKLVAALMLEGAIFRRHAASPTTARGAPTGGSPAGGLARNARRARRRTCSRRT